MEAAFEKAQKKWAQHITFKFQKATTGAPNLFIHVVGPNDYPFLQNPGAQGRANIGPAGPITAPSNIYFKGPGTTWGPGAIHTLFLHEFGHVLGLHHSNNQGAIMAPSIQGMFSERQLTAVDSKRAQIIASGGNPNTSEYMLMEGQRPGQQRQRPGPQNNNQRFNPAQRQRPGPQYNQRFNQAQRPQYNRFNPVRQQQPFSTRGRAQN
ncbi:hypothetical protein H072_2672 [Dactylellina haptotyla CBS 200.50]|uniref:Peptidase M10 metallopeptidase domain-containing protein n=1 Tax=Dactylellina haptotyla (strain CBS 200.50) TaxID=1284197 RepID=S8AQP9_DACHA|nr:hypothetical protein H072_2672 [Dactylellina haptotyla CBS 200.50]